MLILAIDLSWLMSAARMPTSCQLAARSDVERRAQLVDERREGAGRLVNRSVGVLELEAVENLEPSCSREPRVERALALVDERGGGLQEPRRAVRVWIEPSLSLVVSAV